MRKQHLTWLMSVDNIKREDVDKCRRRPPSPSEVLGKDLCTTRGFRRAQMVPVPTYEGPPTKSAPVLSVCHPDVALASTLTHSKVSARKQP